MKTTYDLQYSKLDWLVMFAIFMFPVTFLTLRHGVHISLFAIFLMAICQFWRIGIKKIQFDYPQDFFILFIFSGLFFSVLLSQIFRGEIDFAAFDGPSRILLSGVVFMFLRQSNISTIKILAIAIPAGLICTFLELRLNSSSHWGVRYAIYFVDPNTLGSQAFILALLSFVMTSIVRKKISPLLLLQIIGGLVGLFISIGSSSRGGWLAVPFIFILMFVIRCGDILNSPKIIRARLWLRTILFISLLGSIGICALYFSDSTRERLITGYYGVYQWFSGENLMTSAGIRLSMWKLGLQFSNQSLLFGYGEEKNLTLLLQNIYPNISENMIVNAIADTGPHSDIMSKLLSAGIFGLAAYFGLLMLPFIIFWQYRNTVNLDKRAAARVGLFYITGVFIAGLSNEQLSLKYLCTFYGLMIATLLAQVLHKPFTAENLKTGTFS